VASSSSAYVTASVSATIACCAPIVRACSASNAGMVSASGLTEQLLQGLLVDLAARHHRHVGVGDDDDRARHLVGGEPRSQLFPQHVDVDWLRRAHERGDNLAAVVVVDTGDVGDETRGLEDRGLDLT